MAWIAILLVKVYVAFCGCVDYALNVIESSCKRVMGLGYSNEQQQNAVPNEEKPRKKQSMSKEEKPEFGREQNSKSKKSPDKKKRFDKNRNSVAVNNFIEQVERSTQTENFAEQIKEALKLLVKQTQTDSIECELNTSFTQTDFLIENDEPEIETESPVKIELELSTFSQQTDFETVYTRDMISWILLFIMLGISFFLYFNELSFQDFGNLQ